MELLTGSAVWLGLFSVGVLAAWLKGFLNQFLPPPQRAWLAITNCRRTRTSRPEDRFRFVLCWLEDDTAGRDTKTVGQAFTGVEGVELVRSACIVKASGAADDWRLAMRKGARKVLDKWKADLTVVGSVKESGKALNLWVVPREGDGTLRLADRPYELKNVTLQKEFHEDLRAQLVAVALRAVAPLADTEVRGRVLEKELTAATKKLATLLKGGTITGDDHRAALSLAYGDALAALGERESGSERLEQAVDAYTQALEVFTRDGAPLQWAVTQNNLGNVHLILGERESSPVRLEQAVDAYTQALEVYTCEDAPFQWAMTQNNLGNALRTLGERESGRDRLEQAIAAYTQALKEFKECTRKRAPLEWAMIQNNLGNALWTLGALEQSPTRVEQAIAAYMQALKERIRKRVPLQWATTQNNLGSAYQTLGALEKSPTRVEQAIDAYTQALKECTRKRAPLDWAMIQNNLGNAYQTLGALEKSPKRVEQAIAAHNRALQVFDAEATPQDWQMAQNNLARAVKLLRELEAAHGPEDTRD